MSIIENINSKFFVIKDPIWYLKNQNEKNKIYSNSIFLLLAMYYFFRKNNNNLASLFLLLFIGSTTFHYKTNKYTLFFDRITMILVFSYFFHLFYDKISFFNYSILGIITVIYWLYTENLLLFFLYQLAGLLLFLVYYPMDFLKKLILIISYILISYILITYSQVLEKGKYHSLKHLALGSLSLILI